MKATSFKAKSIHGEGIARTLQTPTINIDPCEVPNEIEEGIHAGWIMLDEVKIPAVIHYGPRLFHKKSSTFEIHLLDQTIQDSQDTILIEVLQKIRNIHNFETEEELRNQIQLDIASARAILDEQ